jgi:hypothetical protein
MGHKCFISFKTEDAAFKQYIQNSLGVDMVDRSLNESIDSDDEDYIMQKIRNDYLSDSTVTIHLIGTRSAEDLGRHEHRFIKRELQASLYNGKGNTRNGILGVVTPAAHAVIFKGTYSCLQCGNGHNFVGINDSTAIREFSYNYYLPNNKCSHPEEDRYCVLCAWEDFCASPEAYIEMAFNKRTAEIADKVKVYGH